MPNEIHVKLNNPVTDDAAVVTAFNTLMTTLRALPGAKAVDAGGTKIGGIKRAGDEEDATKNKLPFGTTF